MSNIISVKNLVKVYANGTKALDGISFNIEEGGFFGFLGPNGAGKSTTIKILCSEIRRFLKPSQLNILKSMLCHSVQMVS